LHELKLREFIKSRFPGYRDDLAVTDDLTDIVDSLGLFELVAFVEAEFRVSIPTAMFSPDRFASIQQTLAFIEELQSIRARR
jgi:acyl carrier protein